ncbi:hypothetical protein F4777DRAFT_569009 [Nemania sp. FL0916]|nr:hypothetical protein F4777DRAFT_569009 [Nemania sp. FL0916]
MSDTNSDNSERYRLGRTYAASSRLNLQHFLWKNAQGFLLHPVIQAQLRDRHEQSSNSGDNPFYLADLATGTGIWLFDLAKSSDSSGLNMQYHGFDISRVLFPHNSWLPNNIVLSTSNVLALPPQSLHGQFDVVHLRLVLPIVRSGSPKPIIQHIKMLLKPGGYVQWDEIDIFNHYDVVTPDPNVDAPNMTAAFQKIKDLADWSWIKRLPQTLAEEGFEKAVQHHYEPGPEMFMAWAHMNLCTAEDLSLNWFDQDDEEDGEEWRKLLPKACEESDEPIRAGHNAHPTITIAMKPL